VSEFIPVAIKRAWVPEWLFRLATHWLPLAKALCESPKCACGEVAEFYTDNVFECSAHYRAALVAAQEKGEAG